MAALSGVAGVTGSAAVRRDPGRITSCPRLVLQAILYLLFPVDAAWSPSFWGGAQYGGWRRRAKERATRKQAAGARVRGWGRQGGEEEKEVGGGGLYGGGEYRGGVHGAQQWEAYMMESRAVCFWKKQ